MIIDFFMDLNSIYQLFLDVVVLEHIHIAFFTRLWDDIQVIPRGMPHATLSFFLIINNQIVPDRSFPIP